MDQICSTNLFTVVLFYESALHTTEFHPFCKRNHYEMEVHIYSSINLLETGGGGGVDGNFY